MSGAKARHSPRKTRLKALKYGRGANSKRLPLKAKKATRFKDMINKSPQ